MHAPDLLSLTSVTIRNRLALATTQRPLASAKRILPNGCLTSSPSACRIESWCTMPRSPSPGTGFCRCYCGPSLGGATRRPLGPAEPGPRPLAHITGPPRTAAGRALLTLLASLPRDRPADQSPSPTRSAGRSWRVLTIGLCRVTPSRTSTYQRLSGSSNGIIAALALGTVFATRRNRQWPSPQCPRPV
jgi:hypothetical protein